MKRIDQKKLLEKIATGRGKNKVNQLSKDRDANFVRKHWIDEEASFKNFI